MATRICMSCKEEVRGFVFCPNCGTQTDLIETSSNSINNMLEGKINLNGSNQLAMWCHLAPLLIGLLSSLLSIIAVGFILILFAWVPPLIIKSNNSRDENVVKHANEALNFQFFWLITGAVLFIVYLLIGILTLGIGFIVGGIAGLILVLPVMLFILISQIRATIAASSGKDFRYPLVLFRLIKSQI